MIKLFDYTLRNSDCYEKLGQSEKALASYLNKLPSEPDEIDCRNLYAGQYLIITILNLEGKYCIQKNHSLFNLSRKEFEFSKALLLIQPFI